jgi:hypothetical protein
MHDPDGPGDSARNRAHDRDTIERGAVVWDSVGQSRNISILDV